MMHRSDIARLRTQLREVNIEFSTLVREVDVDHTARLEQLKVRRAGLMALIADTTREERRPVQINGSAAAHAA